jgi:predicted transcriptional regulator
VIEEVLELIVNRGIINKREIAEEIGVQVETLDDVIDLLCQRGYLRMTEKKCSESSSCSGCSLAESCGSADKLGRALFVTDKGKQLVKSRRVKRE